MVIHVTSMSKANTLQDPLLILPGKTGRLHTFCREVERNVYTWSARRWHYPDVIQDASPLPA